MKHELKPLEKLCQTIVKGQSTPETITLLYEQEERLPEAITERIFGLTSDYLIRQYICWHQDLLGKQADKLYRKVDTASGINIKKAIVVILNLLNYLNRFFPEHFDNVLPLPRIILDREKPNFRNHLVELTNILNRYQINSELVKLTLQPLTAFLAKSHEKRPSYSEYRYIQYYVNGLKELDFEITEYEVRDYALTDKLITLNHNSIHMLGYCTKEIGKYLKKYTETELKEKVLNVTRKILKQLPVVAGISYDKHFMPIREALLQWANEEMNFLTGKTKRSSDMPKATSKKLQKLRLPVPQMALLAALLYNNGLYTEADKNIIIGHWLDTYCSKETDQISEGSFRNHFNKPTSLAARGLRKLMRKLLDDLNNLLS